ncbi:unnamed protein product, partial [Pleuronectes platessa]
MPCNLARLGERRQRQKQLRKPSAEEPDCCVGAVSRPGTSEEDVTLAVERGWTGWNCFAAIVATLDHFPQLRLAQLPIDSRLCFQAHSGTQMFLWKALAGGNGPILESLEVQHILGVGSCQLALWACINFHSLAL